MSISRRSVLKSFALGAPALCLNPSSYAAKTISGASLPAIEEGPFKGTRASLKAYEIPEWFRDAKFGIWAHWGPQSAVEYGDWYARNMYIEGYKQNEYHLKR